MISYFLVSFMYLYFLILFYLVYDYNRAQYLNVLFYNDMTNVITIIMN